jgi:hypothetical protein
MTGIDHGINYSGSHYNTNAASPGSHALGMAGIDHVNNYNGRPTQLYSNNSSSYNAVSPGGHALSMGGIDHVTNYDGLPPQTNYPPPVQGNVVVNNNGSSSNSWSAESSGELSVAHFPASVSIGGVSGRIGLDHVPTNNGGYHLAQQTVMATDRMSSLPPHGRAATHSTTGSLNSTCTRQTKICRGQQVDGRVGRLILVTLRAISTL